jgi:hypothetical protein
MKADKIIELGTKLGLTFHKSTNFPDALLHDRVVFDGCNGQRFLIEGEWDDDKILRELGASLILLGRREKCLAIYHELSITSDN